MTMTPDDSRALSIYQQARALSEIGLAPLVFDVIGPLKLSREEAHGLVGRLVTIVQAVNQHHAQQAKQAHPEAEIVDAAERDGRRRRG